MEQITRGDKKHQKFTLLFTLFIVLSNNGSITMDDIKVTSMLWIIPFSIVTLMRCVKHK